MDIASLSKKISVLLVAVVCFALPAHSQTTNDYRKILAQVVLTEDADAQIELTKQLIDSTDELVSRALTSWRMGELYVHTTAEGEKIPLVLDSQLDSEGNATLAGTADAQTVNVNTGTLSLAAGDLLADNADVTVAALVTLTLNGNDTVGSLALSGTVNGIGTLNAGTYVLTEGNYDLDLGTGNLTSRGRSRLNGSSGATSPRIFSRRAASSC